MQRANSAPVRSAEEIQKQIKSLNIDGVGRLLGRMEIKELPNILWEYELIEDLVQGRYQNKNGLLVATSKRLIFIDKGFFGKLTVEEFPFDKISSIQYQAGLLLGTITIFASGNKAEIENVDKKRVKAFGNYLRTRISDIGTKDAGSQSPMPNNAQQDDTISQLERLAALKEQGILTEDEFQKQKQAILS